MRIYKASILLLGCIAMIACKDERFDLTKNPLGGTIGGAEWIYTVGGAGQDFTTGHMNTILLNLDISDPCAVVNTIRPHITMRFPPRRGNYTLSVDNVQVIFNQEGGSVKYTATAGFLEIVEITGTEIIGFLSANFDDNNVVEGSFLLRVCD